MVELLRVDKFKFKSDYELNGLFVFDKPNNSKTQNTNLNIIKYIAHDKFIVLINNKKVEFYSKNLINNIAQGDILDFDNNINTIFVYLTSLTDSNTILVTERCNSNCIFCSQPPQKIDDNYLYDKAYKAIYGFNTDDYIGISGGEPTYNKKMFLDMLLKLKEVDNKTPLHILTNGKSFADIDFVKKFETVVSNKKVILAIPIYSHNFKLHDFIVQSNNSFHKTVNGIINLIANGFNVEIRIVVNKYNIQELEYIIDFIFSTFKIIGSISIMNIEPIGYARVNYDDIYVEVKNQNKYLKKAIYKSTLYDFPISLYNYPYCLLDYELRSLAIKSISDWKNYYPSDCNLCVVKKLCGGFFISANNKFREKVEPIYET